MTADILEELLLGLQDKHLMKQSQAHIVLQLARILQKPTKDIKMCLVLFGPALQ